MNTSKSTNRRTFLQYAGAVSSSILWPGRLLATDSNLYDGASAIRSHYVLSTEQNRVEVYRKDGQRWIRAQVVLSQSPASLAIHPNRQFLYVANGVALHEGLPQGTIEVYSINRQSGTLSLVQRHALSLSGTEPRSLVITPDGRYLLVALYGGGAYNVLSIEQNGERVALRQIFKELGSGLHSSLQTSSHPHTLLFDPSGSSLLATDFGCDQVNVFALSWDGKLERKSKHAITPGAGPGSMALSSDVSSLYVMHELTGAISCHRYRQSEATIEKAFQTVLLQPAHKNGVPVRGDLKLDATGGYLSAYLPGRVTRWTVGSSGELLNPCNRITPGRLPALSLAD